MSRWTERWWRALGTDAHVQIRGGAPDLAVDAIDRLEAMEQCWSRFRPTSELCRLNDDPRPTVPVSRLLAEAISRAVLAWRLTDGLFDPTVLDSLERSGYSGSFVADGPRRGLLGSDPAAGCADVEVDLDRGLVTRPAGVRFDLGGIGKGLAADRLAVGLIDDGASGVCVGLGGDIRVAGDAPVGRWRIPVDDPLEPSTAVPWFTAEMEGGAIVTSTTQFRRWVTLDGETAHHLIDPHTGRPSTSGVRTVVVAAAEAWWAEVLAKAALVAGETDGRALLDRHGVTGWIVRGEIVPGELAGVS